MTRIPAFPIGVDRREVARRIHARKTVGLDLGCGAHKTPGTFGVDARALPGVDLVWDLEHFPWPIPDDCARTVFMSHFWEHLKPWLTLKFMAEVHRVCQHGAQVLIAAPYGAEFRFVQDPTHCNPSNEATFCYWDKAHESQLWTVYQPPVFHLDRYDIIPVGPARDFNAFLTCCKFDADPVAHGCAKCAALPGAPTGKPSVVNPPAGRARSGRGASRRRAGAKTPRGR